MVLGEISGLKRGHGVALAYPTGYGFVTSGADSTVTMFDLKTLASLKRIHAAVDDDAVHTRCVAGSTVIVRAPVIVGTVSTTW